jgi:hypothetical protein
MNNAGGAFSTLTPSERLIGLRLILDMTDESDWYMIHRSVSDDVLSGKMSKHEYAKMVDRILDERIKERG